MDSIKESFAQWLSGMGMSQGSITRTEQIAGIAFVIALAWLADFVC